MKCPLEQGPVLDQPTMRDDTQNTQQNQSGQSHSIGLPTTVEECPGVQTTPTPSLQPAVHLQICQMKQHFSICLPESQKCR